MSTAPDFAPPLWESACFPGFWAGVRFLSSLLVAPSRYFRISTGELNRVVRDAVARHAPPGKMSALKFYYTTQVGVAPPTFVFFVNKPELVHFTYQRYLENQLREFHPFEGTPIRLIFKPRSEDRYGK